MFEVKTLRLMLHDKQMNPCFSRYSLYALGKRAKENIGKNKGKEVSSEQRFHKGGIRCPACAAYYTSLESI